MPVGKPDVHTVMARGGPEHVPFAEMLMDAGALVSAYDPLLSPEETARCCATPWTWGQPAPFRAIITQTADPLFARLDLAWFPDLELVFDGRDSLGNLPLPPTVAYRGIGVPPRRRSVAPAAAQTGPGAR